MFGTSNLSPPKRGRLALFDSLRPYALGGRMVNLKDLSVLDENNRP